MFCMICARLFKLCRILTIYMKKVLRIIDPTDSLLDIVAQPVRKYLRNRNDTVRCIISRYVCANETNFIYFLTIILCYVFVLCNKFDG